MARVTSCALLGSKGKLMVVSLTCKDSFSPAMHPGNKHAVLRLHIHAVKEYGDPLHHKKLCAGVVAADLLSRIDCALFVFPQ